MQDGAERVLQAHAEAKSHRGTFEEHWQQIADYGLGRRDFTVDHVTQGRKRQTLIFDATFQQAALDYASALQALTFSSASKWMWAAPEDYGVLRDEPARLWYEDTTQRAYHMFNHPEAGFSVQAHEMLVDFSGFGTGCLFTDEKEFLGGDLFFSARPLSEIFVGESAEGRVNQVFRRFHYTARQAVEKFGEETVGQDIRDAWKTGRQNDRFEFIHAVMPENEVKSFLLKPGRFPIASVYVDVRGRRIVREGGYHEMPYAVPRDIKDPGERYGRGPGIAAIPDAKMLNRMQRARIVGAEKAVDPPVLIADDGVISPVRTQPGGINIVRALPGGMEPMRHMENRARYDISETALAAVQQQVKGHFKNKLWETGDLAQPRMTVPQVLEMTSREVQLVGPTIYRLQIECIEVTARRVIGLMDRAGMLLPKPESIRGMPLKVDYVSPGARAQKNADAQSILAVMSTAGEYGQLDEDVMDVVDLDKGLRALDEAVGRTGILRTERAVRQIRDAKNALAEEEAEAQRTAQAVDTASRVTPALEALQGGMA